MNRSARLRPALDVAERREREAAAELARARRVLTEAETRLAELRRFHDEYAERFAKPPAGAVQSAGLLKDGQAFLARVDSGIVQAERFVLEQQRVCETSRARWLEQRVRASAIEKLSERHRAREARQAERVEQNEQDELARRPER